MCPLQRNAGCLGCDSGGRNGRLNQDGLVKSAGKQCSRKEVEPIPPRPPPAMGSPPPPQGTQPKHVQAHRGSE